MATKQQRRTLAELRSRAPQNAVARAPMGTEVPLQLDMLTQRGKQRLVEGYERLRAEGRIP